MIATTDFTDHQRNVFCVFSGSGVVSLRRHLNTTEEYAHLRDPTPNGRSQTREPFGDWDGPSGPDHVQGGDAGFDEPERDVVEDDDVLDDGSEMVIDAPQQNDGVGGASLDASMIPPPPPAPPQVPAHAPQAHQWYPNLPLFHSAPLPSILPMHNQGWSVPAPPAPIQSVAVDPMEVSPSQAGASTATVGSSSRPGPSTASLNGTPGSNPGPGHGLQPEERRPEP